MPLVKGAVVVVEGSAARRPVAMIVQGTDARGRWKLKLTGESGISLASQRHGVTVLVDGIPHTVTGHNGNHLRVEPVQAGWGSGPRPERRRVPVKRKSERGDTMLLQAAKLVPLVGDGAIHVNIPANHPPAAVLIWGEPHREHAYVLTGGQANPASPLIYHEMSCHRLDRGLLGGVLDDVRTTTVAS